RLTHAFVGQRSARLVDGDHHLARRGAADHLEIWVLLKLRELFERAELADDVDVAGFQCIVHGVAVADEAELDLRQPGFVAPVVVVAGEGEARATIPAPELEGSGADRLGGVVRGRLAGPDASRASR